MSRKWLCRWFDRHVFGNLDRRKRSRRPPKSRLHIEVASRARLNLEVLEDRTLLSLAPVRFGTEELTLAAAASGLPASTSAAFTELSSVADRVQQAEPSRDLNDLQGEREYIDGRRAEIQRELQTLAAQEPLVVLDGKGEAAGNGKTAKVEAGRINGILEKGFRIDLDATVDRFKFGAFASQYYTNRNDVQRSVFLGITDGGEVEFDIYGAPAILGGSTQGAGIQPGKAFHLSASFDTETQAREVGIDGKPVKFVGDKGTAKIKGQAIPFSVGNIEDGSAPLHGTVRSFTVSPLGASTETAGKKLALVEEDGRLEARQGELTLELGAVKATLAQARQVADAFFAAMSTDAEMEAQPDRESTLAITEQLPQSIQTTTVAPSVGTDVTQPTHQGNSPLLREAERFLQESASTVAIGHLREITNELTFQLHTLTNYVALPRGVDIASVVGLTDGFLRDADGSPAESRTFQTLFGDFTVDADPYHRGRKGYMVGGAITSSRTDGSMHEPVYLRFDRAQPIESFTVVHLGNNVASSASLFYADGSEGQVTISGSGTYAVGQKPIIGVSVGYGGASYGFTRLQFHAPAGSPTVADAQQQIATIRPVLATLHAHLAAAESGLETYRVTPSIQITSTGGHAIGLSRADLPPGVQAVVVGGSVHNPAAVLLPWTKTLATVSLAAGPGSTMLIVPKEGVATLLFLDTKTGKPLEAVVPLAVGDGKPADQIVWLPELRHSETVDPATMDPAELAALRARAALSIGDDAWRPMDFTIHSFTNAVRTPIVENIMQSAGIRLPTLTEIMHDMAPGFINDRDNLVSFFEFRISNDDLRILGNAAQIRLQREYPRLFDEVAWSIDRVLELHKAMQDGHIPSESDWRSLTQQHPYFDVLFDTIPLWESGYHRRVQENLGFQQRPTRLVLTAQDDGQHQLSAAEIDVGLVAEIRPSDVTFDSATSATADAIHGGRIATRRQERMDAEGATVSDMRANERRLWGLLYAAFPDINSGRFDAHSTAYFPWIELESSPVNSTFDAHRFHVLEGGETTFSLFHIDSPNFGSSFDLGSGDIQTTVNARGATAKGDVNAISASSGDNHPLDFELLGLGAGAEATFNIGRNEGRIGAGAYADSISAGVSIGDITRLRSDDLRGTIDAGFGLHLGRFFVSWSDSDRDGYMNYTIDFGAPIIPVGVKLQIEAPLRNLLESLGL